MKPPELIVIRHGESDWNARGLWQGQADPPLSPTGRAQAVALARSLAGERIDRIESSDLQRARQTAEPLAAEHGLVLRTDPLYRELDIGEWSGLTRQQIAARGEEVFAVFQSRSPDAVAPGGESRRQLWQRAHRALERLCERYPGEHVAVVTHGGFVYACFPDADARNASVHRAPADVLLARIERGLGSARSDAY